MYCPSIFLIIVYKNYFKTQKANSFYFITFNLHWEIFLFVRIYNFLHNYDCCYFNLNFNNIELNCDLKGCLRRISLLLHFIYFNVYSYFSNLNYLWTLRNFHIRMKIYSLKLNYNYFHFFYWNFRNIKNNHQMTPSLLMALLQLFPVIAF